LFLVGRCGEGARQYAISLGAMFTASPDLSAEFGHRRPKAEDGIADATDTSAPSAMIADDRRLKEQVAGPRAASASPAGA